MLISGMAAAVAPPGCLPITMANRSDKRLSAEAELPAPGNRSGWNNNRAQYGHCRRPGWRNGRAWFPAAFPVRPCAPAQTLRRVRAGAQGLADGDRAWSRFG